MLNIQGRSDIPADSSIKQEKSNTSCHITLCALGIIVILGGFAASGALLPHMGFLSFSIAAGATVLGGGLMITSCVLIHKKPQVTINTQDSSSEEVPSEDDKDNNIEPSKAEKVTDGAKSGASTPSDTEEDEEEKTLNKNPATPMGSTHASDDETEVKTKPDNNVDPTNVEAQLQRIIDDEDTGFENIDEILYAAQDNEILGKLLSHAHAQDKLGLILDKTNDLKTILHIAQQENILEIILKASIEAKILRALWDAAADIDLDLVKVADDLNLLPTVLKAADASGDLDTILKISKKTPNPLFGELNETEIDKWLGIIQEHFDQGILQSDTKLTEAGLHEAEHGNKNYAGRNHLHYAAGRDNTIITVYLVTKGFDINHKDDQGATPLHYAVKAGSKPVVLYLLKQQNRVHAIKSLKTPATGLVFKQMKQRNADKLKKF